MSNLNILVCGAGIAGSTAAYWLAKAGNNVTMIERAPEIRNSGLGVDLRGPAVEVVRRMGLEEQIRSSTTGEEGISFVDSKDHTFAHFGIDQDNLENSPTSEIEIMRSDLAKLITAAALNNPNVHTRYGTTVEAIIQDEKQVSVRFNDGQSTTFDIVIGADGLGSTTRKLLLDGQINNNEAIHSLGQYTAYFTIPYEKQDGKVWKWYTATESRIISTRPKNADSSCAYLTIMPKDMKQFRDLMKQGVDEQKKQLTTLFEGAGWQTPRLMAAMQTADDFYLQHIAQVKIPTWQSGRCVVVGDAAYGPSPLSGVGTSLAVLGAYILAGEIVTSKGDHQHALQSYEQRLRPYVEKKQKIPPGVPGIVCPTSAWGVSIFRWVVWFAALSGVAKWFGGQKDEDKFVVPDYDFEQSR